MLPVAVASLAEILPPARDPDPDEPIEWVRRQLTWERRLDALREASDGLEDPAPPPVLLRRAG